MAHPHKKKPLSSNRQQIAKALRDATGLTYQQALRRVEDAAARGVLPAVLNKEGREEAVRLLSSTELATVSDPPSGSRVRESSSGASDLASLFQRGGSEKTMVRSDPPTAADFAAAAGVHYSRVLIFDLDTQPSLSGPWPAPALDPFAYEPVVVDVPPLGMYDPSLGLTAAQQDEVLRQLRPPAES